MYVLLCIGLYMCFGYSWELSHERIPTGAHNIGFLSPDMKGGTGNGGSPVHWFKHVLWELVGVVSSRRFL